MIRGSNLSDNVGIRLDEDDLVFLDEATVEKYARSVVGPGDLIFTCWGTVGQIGLIGPASRYKRYIVSNKQMKMSPDTRRCSSSFLYYYLSQPRMTELVRGSAIGSSVPGFNLGQLKALPVRIPALSVQVAIAEVLGALDDKIAANERAVLAGEQLLLALVETTTSRTALEELATRSRKSVKPKATDIVSHFSLPAFDEGQSPAVEAGDSIKSNKFLLDGPCVLMSKLNPRIPRIWNVSQLPEGTCMASTEFVVLVPRQVSTHALWAALSHVRVRDELMGKVAGTSGSHQRVKPEEILALEVADVRTLPNTSRDQVEAIGALGHRLRVETRQLARTRDQLLPLLMSGKVTVKDVEGEVEDLL